MFKKNSWFGDFWKNSSKSPLLQLTNVQKIDFPLGVDYVRETGSLPDRTKNQTVFSLGLAK